MCHAQHRTASLLAICLTLLFCCTALSLAPSPAAARANIAGDGLVFLSNGTEPAVSQSQRAWTRLPADRQRLLQEVQAAADRTEGVTMGRPAVYPAPLTVTAADFSAYRRTGAGNLTDGAVITYSTLIPLEVTGLQPGAASGENNFQLLNRALDLVSSFTVDQADRYRDVMFKVTLPPGTYSLSYRNGAEQSSQCLHLCRNTWLSMNGVTLRKADTVNGAMLRNCVGSSGASGYGASGNLILEGGVWDVNMAHFDAGSTTDRFSTIRLGHGENVLFTGVTFLGSVNGHHLELCGIRGCSVVNCTFRGYLDTAYRGHYDYKEAIQIDVVNNEAIAPAFGRYDDTVSGDVVVYGNRFQNLCRGVGGHNAVYGVYYARVVVQNNTFSHLTADAFYGLNYQDTLIDGNTLNQVGAGIALYTLTPAADDNYFRPCTGSLPPLAAVQRRYARITISDNDILVTPFSPLRYGCGVMAYGCAYSDRLFQQQYGGATFWIRGVTVTGNRIRWAQDAGIFLHCAADAAVSDNWIERVLPGYSLAGEPISTASCLWRENGQEKTPFPQCVGLSTAKKTVILKP